MMNWGNLLDVSVLLAAIGALGLFIKYLSTKDTNDTKTDIAALKAENERRRLADTAVNQFQANLLQQIKALQDELSLVRGRCNELEGLNRDNNRRIRELEDEIARLEREKKMAEIVAIPGGRK